MSRDARRRRAGRAGGCRRRRPPHWRRPPRRRRAQHHRASTSAARRTAPAGSSCSSSRSRDARQPQAGRRPRDRRLHRRHASATDLMQALRRHRFRDAGDIVRRDARSATARASSSRRPATSSSSPTRPTTSTWSSSARALARPQPSTQKKKEYTGERLTLNFQDIETRAVLQLLADTSGQNIVVSATRCRATSRCACRTCRGTRRSTSC